MALEVRTTAPRAAPAPLRREPGARSYVVRAWPQLFAAGLLLALLVEGLGFLQARSRYSSDAEQLQVTRQGLARSAALWSGQGDLDLQRRTLDAQVAALAAAVASPPRDLAGAVLTRAAEGGLQVSSVTAGRPSQQRVGNSPYVVQGVTVAGRGTAEGWRRFLAQVENGALGLSILESSRIDLQQGQYAGTAAFSVYSRLPGPGAAPAAVAPSVAPRTELTAAWQRGGWELTVALLERALATAPDDREVRQWLVEAHLQWAVALAGQGDGARAAQSVQRARILAGPDPLLLRRLESLVMPEAAGR